VDETALEFARTFNPLPEPESAAAPLAAPPASLRLTLAPTSRCTFSLQRARVAALDVGIVVAVALLVALPVGFTAWGAIACCALAYYAGSSLWPGRTPAAMWLRYDASGAAPREVRRSSHEPHTPPAEIAMTLAADDGRDDAHAARERRSGQERRRRSTEHVQPRYGEGERRGLGMGIPAVH
jgi:hypothetical protein